MALLFTIAIAAEMPMPVPSAAIAPLTAVVVSVYVPIALRVTSDAFERVRVADRRRGRIRHDVQRDRGPHSQLAGRDGALIDGSASATLLAVSAERIITASRRRSLWTLSQSMPWPN